ncbi:Gfo/Idh/MocA family oxidoreductase [Colwellia sp. MB3u-8]|uniref:Gfo/Idh/MocA family protein n=1 Tax=Colwellia sp. MB3u-8 TaxID=2759818 RepID=UPI0028705F21|nr:Gfo/Idh/MocA family oxidoreductase [Colwellia sp. MB3u-8]
MNFGVIGCGSIAQLFVKGVQRLAHCNLLAGASCTAGRAEAFAKKFGIERAYTNYEALASDPEIDAVYIATTHNFHFENIKLCLEKGKHVLCEKPFTVNAQQAKILVALAKKQQCFMMECVWTRFLPAIKHLNVLLAQGVIGDVQTVKANFSISGDFSPEHRLRNKDLAGGALLDLGIYPLTLAALVFNEQPTKIKSSAVLGETEVDESSFYLLEYAQGQRAVLSSSFIDNAPTEAIISGSKGYIRLPNFLAAQTLQLYIGNEAVQTLEFPFDEDESFTFEIADAMQCIRQGKSQSDTLPLAKTLAMITTMDTIRAQWGLKYANES